MDFFVYISSVVSRFINCWFNPRIHLFVSNKQRLCQICSGISHDRLFSFFIDSPAATAKDNNYCVKS
ncbi:unnamed protein product [Acanthoscelides obtectus]|uniref:Uncharacterized protein n=1 Tax=Acanthoscelides obtectus TaxID=200917 RepID=A0A9P0JYE3_ACAOB|nr:unnamed protein product [Acanthoscelides obtectus]CAK1668491.1 hypothetical protein AOBTE_LOCUS26434 [Acanthoscelides obtectus]